MYKCEGASGCGADGAAGAGRSVPGEAALGNISTLGATKGHIDGFFSELPYKCYLPEVASV